MSRSINSSFSRDFPLKYLQVSFATQFFSFATTVPFMSCTTAIDIIRYICRRSRTRHGIEIDPADVQLAFRSGTNQYDTIPNEECLMTLPYVLWALDEDEEIRLIMIQKPPPPPLTDAEKLRDWGTQAEAPTGEASVDAETQTFNAMRSKKIWGTPLAEKTSPHAYRENQQRAVDETSEVTSTTAQEVLDLEAALPRNSSAAMKLNWDVFTVPQLDRTHEESFSREESPPPRMVAQSVERAAPENSHDGNKNSLRKIVGAAFSRKPASRSSAEQQRKANSPPRPVYLDNATVPSSSSRSEKDLLYERIHMLEEQLLRTQIDVELVMDRTIYNPSLPKEISPHVSSLGHLGLNREKGAAEALPQTTATTSDYSVSNTINTSAVNANPSPMRKELETRSGSGETHSEQTSRSPSHFGDYISASREREGESTKIQTLPSLPQAQAPDVQRSREVSSSSSHPWLVRREEPFKPAPLSAPVSSAHEERVVLVHPLLPLDLTKTFPSSHFL